MAKNTIQIADKPTLDEVATDVETLKELVADKPTLDEVATDVEALKAELASMSELVTSISKKVGVVEPDDGETVEVIGGAVIPTYVESGEISGTSTKTFQHDKGGFLKCKYISVPTKLVIDGVTVTNISAFIISHITYFNTASGVNNYYSIEIPFKKTCAVTGGTITYTHYKY